MTNKPSPFSSLAPKGKPYRPIDPLELFRSLRKTDPQIGELWLAQGDALRTWHSSRKKTDIAIMLNTGAGKTLVGMLIAQSLVNETNASVMYACSSIQLVRQTAAMAEGYGLPVTTYFKGEFSNALANQGVAPCLTTYQALFTGKSKFFKREIAGIVFDDAHTAESIMRDAFTLHIAREHASDLYLLLAREFADYFRSVGMVTSYEDVVEREKTGLLLVPPFEIRKSFETLRKLLHDSTVPSDTKTLFAWEHLKDHIDICAVLVSSSEITITPPYIPVRTLSYFARDLRRVYLSATLSAQDAFIRTFGNKPDLQISPSTSAGECERMIILPTATEGCESDIVATKEAIRQHKTLILVPSYQRAAEWSDVAELPEADQTATDIEAFRANAKPIKLVLAARYDGVDLPGDSCRVVVIDDLPSGVSPLERFQWEYLGLSKTLRSVVASRIVQSFGRISRGVKDHGVAILTGRRLVDWLQVPANRSALPIFLQKQLQLGVDISKKVAVDDIGSMIDRCMRRDDDWINAYEDYMQNASAEGGTNSTETASEDVANGSGGIGDASQDQNPLSDLARAEANYAKHMWSREFTQAAESLMKTVEKAGNLSENTACWHKFWAGYALECAGDSRAAMQLYRQARSGSRNIPSYRPQQELAMRNQASQQALTVARLFEDRGNGKYGVPKQLLDQFRNLNGSGSFRQVEEALCYLGRYLGVESSRPEKEHGTGPDVLWVFPDQTAFCIDAKTDKNEESPYKKDDLGQMSDHVQWVRNSIQTKRIVTVFVGPDRPATRSTNPPEGAMILPLENCSRVANVLQEAWQNIAETAMTSTLPSVIEEEFQKRKLLWPNLEKTLSLVSLRKSMGK